MTKFKNQTLMATSVALLLVGGACLQGCSSSAPDASRQAAGVGACQAFPGFGAGVPEEVLDHRSWLAGRQVSVPRCSILTIERLTPADRLTFSPARTGILEAVTPTGTMYSNYYVIGEAGSAIDVTVTSDAPPPPPADLGNPVPESALPAVITLTATVLIVESQE